MAAAASTEAPATEAVVVAATPPCYRLGLSEDQWRAVLEMLDEISLEVSDRVRARYRLSSRTGIPYGAIAAADRGEWWRLHE